MFQVGFHYTDVSRCTVSRTYNFGFLGFCALIIIQHAKIEKENFQELHLFLIIGEGNVNLCGPVFGAYERGVSLNRMN